ncbi:Serine/threonine-protein kinase PINK1 mitochondrial [Taenia crassiceps]|uniref:non-specific serine/threonine protein kinase n=1 Tax=Taenia crassiceps TaxID=6207 RepID=A0ABR4Q928_9CEST
MGKMLLAPGTHARPNSLIRAFNGVATIVRYRNDPLFNDISFSSIYSPLRSYDKLRRNYVKHFRFEQIEPGKFLSHGAFGAVWAAKYSSVGKDEKQEEIAVKVHYNYCEEDSEDGDTTSTNHLYLLHKQRDREVNLRPPGRHPNVVSILHFFYRAPPVKTEGESGREASWEGVENFPEGFGGRPKTLYLLMERFEGSLEDLLNGRWKPTAVLSSSTASTLFSTHQPGLHETPIEVPSENPTSSQSSLHIPTSNVEPSPFRLPTEEAVGLAVQMVEVVAHLQRYQIAHRDIKPSNFLVKSRSFPNRGDLLNVEMAEAINMHIHLALSDFGCAIRTVNYAAGRNCTTVSHSGNTALWAPEVAVHFSHRQCTLPSIYSRADLWAVATIVYQLFGQPNPFLSGALSSLDYAESELPILPSDAPGVLVWMLHSCLRRNPSTRPPPRLVADILHTWCLLVNLKRLLCPRVLDKVVPQVPLPTEILANAGGGGLLNSEETWLRMRLAAEGFSRLRKTLADPLRQKLRHLLQLAWAADWLLGAGKSTGLRYLFYQRVTLERFAFCLAFAQFAEKAKLIGVFK